MDNSILLAKLFGYVLVLISLNIFFCAKHFKNYLAHMLENVGVANLMSMLTTIFGVLLLLTHNLWTSGWTVVVTILCWIVMIRGLYGFFLPEGMAKVAKKMIESKSAVYIVAIIDLFVGAFLLFMAYM